MATINFDSELRRAGAHSTHGWRRLLFLVLPHHSPDGVTEERLSVGECFVCEYTE